MGGFRGSDDKFWMSWRRFSWYSGRL